MGLRVLISGGGTGGHINPALAIAEKIRQENPDAVIEYVGTEKGLETKLVPRAGYPIHYVKVEGLRRSFSAENIRAAAEAVTSVYEAKRIIRQFHPDIVIGTGGYVCWPVLRAASSMKIPTVVHESNALPGVATRMLAKYADVILLNFRESETILKEMHTRLHAKLITVGNPVRPEMFDLAKAKAACREKLGFREGERILLSYGGSLGAKRINKTVFEMISSGLLPQDIRHIHATGNGYWDEAQRIFTEKGFLLSDENTLEKGKTVLKKYIYNMPEQLACADLVICRAGAMTVSEIAAMEKAAIFVPSPNVTDNHQYKNALVLKRAGAAELIEEKNLTPSVLADTVTRFFSDDRLMKTTGDRARTFAEPKCLDKIYDVISELVKKDGMS